MLKTSTIDCRRVLGYHAQSGDCIGKLFFSCFSCTETGAIGRHSKERRVYGNRTPDAAQGGIPDNRRNWKPLEAAYRKPERAIWTHALTVVEQKAMGGEGYDRSK